MPFNGSQITEYARTTPNDGLLLDAEFGRLYDNDNALKAQADAADDAVAAINTELGVSPKGSYADLVARLAALDNYLRVGKLEWFDEWFQYGENAPWLILSDPDAVLNVANWPLLVPHYRQKKVRYMPGTGSAKSAFDVTHYARASNIVTITLANTAAELALLAGLAEENLVHGSFSGWISIYLPAALGSNDVPIGDYAITALDAGARTISFSHTGANVGTTAQTKTIEVYPHRIPGSTTTARHYQITGRTFVSINDSDGEVLAGLRRRDREQGHWHDIPTSYATSNAVYNAAAVNSWGWQDNFPTENNVEKKAKSMISDGTNGTPRTGKTTDPRALAAVPAIWAGKYIAT